MKKKYLPLTDDQKSRGVIFSSQLIPGMTIHEVTEDNKFDCAEGTNRIDLLLNDSFFDHSPFKYNLIRQ